MTRWLILGSALIFAYITREDWPTGPILVILMHALTWHLHVVEVKLNKVMAALGTEASPDDINRG